MIGVLIASLLAMILYLTGVIITVSLSKENTTSVFRRGLVLFVTGFIITAAIFYFTMPTISVPNIIIANTVIAIILLPLFLYSIKPGEKAETRKVMPLISLITIAVISIIVVIITGFVTLDEAHKSIHTSLEEEAKPLTKDETPIAVAPEFARNKIQKAMSLVPNPQFYGLGKLQVQKVNGEVVYIAPVEFSDFWKFVRGKETPGYFMISATNINAQPEFHESTMQYTNSSYFHKNVNRVIYNKYPQYIQLGEAQIEVDEDGKPWYVQTLYRPMHITNKPDMSKLKVVVIDPVTSEMKMYNTSEAPDFIDGSISSEIASLENEYFGKYIHGWLNSIFGKRDVKIPNESGSETSVTPIFDENGKMFYFTDFTSPKENIDSALGYSLIDARTGELTYYSGDQDYAIMDSEGAKQIVNKEFPEKRWEGYMPVLYNIDGNPTWVVNVLDPNGLHKQYAYIKANDSDFVVFGDTANEALSAYRLALVQNPGNVGATDEASLESRTGQISRVLVTSTDQGQVVQFLIDGDQTIYSVNGSKVPLAIFLEKGDQVSAEVRILDNGTAIVNSMEIEGLTP
ncbi:DNA-binding protein [Gracilibacillus oryzae]|uniref:DNA-binding protein n=1 Tax=Gracilibacillus oryzae TaxID=1672701 RepID=A0A7C8KRM5_9BACI|nr:DNA-binding protein [Gracilibacillus oryzae]KAB8131314.1 DNA-binding protein [Gracilibacillus oryzae]